MNVTRLLGLGLVVLLIQAAITPVADAQYRSGRERREDEARARGDDDSSKQESKYPAATRAEPKEKGSAKLGKVLQRLFERYEDNKYAEAIAQADELLANPKASPYDRAKAAQLAAYSWVSSDAPGAYPKAIRYFEQALAANALPNNDHFDMMFTLAQLQMGEDQFEAALATAERFLAESKSDKPELQTLRGNALFRLDRFAEAATVYKGMLAGSAKPDANLVGLLVATYLETDQLADATKVADEYIGKFPDNKVLLLNMASVYLQADQPAKAAGVFDGLKARGMLTESKDYENGYRLLANMDGREKDAIALINEGLGNGILKPNHEIYNFLGQSYYFSGQVDAAIDAWGKAAPLAKDGETYLNLAKVLVQEERWADSKAAGRQALAKGLKQPGEAWMTIARAEYGTDGKNRAAVIAAYREAAKYPETRAKADKQLRQLVR